MGGNALKYTHGLESVRMDLPTYEKMRDNVSKFLDELKVDYRHIKFYHNKTDFGDLDVIVSRANNSVDNIRNHLRMAGLPMTSQLTTPSHTSVVNTLINSHQVDFIFVEPEQLESATTYYSYNDIWNLLGKVIKTHEYKLGWQGLMYTYRHKKHYKEDIVLTTNLYVALEILGLDVERYKLGFDDYQDMFDYVISSPAFDPSKFELENLNHRNRVRDRKRKTYNMFLSYIDGKEYPKPKSLIAPTEKFPFLVDRINIREERFRRVDAAKEIINGGVIVELTGLFGVDVKRILEAIRSRYDVNSILKLSKVDVERIVLETRKELNL